ncbi:MAG: DNA polymerase III subunit delta' [Mariprofundus sp.]|nr:DNA polymerase III subunit delta' [Mariprofundus sp.]
MNHLFGHEASLARFSEALSSGRLHHAWLLYGMKGIGKHRLAEKLAGQLMCETETACGACHGCKMLAASSHPDVHRLALIDEKRDLNIEQIRHVLDFLSLSGAESGRRVVILDDAERMNGQAANALLKGLEEPSAGNVLLIVCSDLERLPATVRSRCMLQACLPLSDTDVRAVLQGQDNPIQEKYLELALALANGSPGAVVCLQDAKVANALLNWQTLIADMADADVGKIEVWIRTHIKAVPHILIVQILANAVYPALQHGEDEYSHQEAIQKALQACLRWPAEVLRHSLRAGPALLACILQLRSAFKA